VPGDHHLSPALKHNLRSHRFQDDREVETDVVHDGSSHNRTRTNINRVYKAGHHDSDICRYRRGDYVEKQLESSTSKSELFLLQLKMKNPKYR